MNNKIELCLYESGLTAQGCLDELDDYAKEAIERFAKLIVRECAQFIFVLDADPVCHKTAARILLEHFGVE